MTENFIQITISIIIVAIVVYWNKKITKDGTPKEDAPSSNHILSLKELRAALKNMGVKFPEPHPTDTSEIPVSYQGGNFSVKYATEGIGIAFYKFYKIPYNATVSALLTINHINSRYPSSIWTCFLTLDDDSKDNEPNINLSTHVSLFHTPAEVQQELESLFIQAFPISRYFCDELDKIMKNNDNPNEAFLKDEFNHHLSLAEHKLEMRHGQIVTTEEENKNPLTIPFFISLFETVKWGDAQSIRIAYADGSENISDNQQLQCFDIRTYIKDNYQQKDLSEITFNVHFPYNLLSIQLLKVNGSTDKSLLYRTAISRIGNEITFVSGCNESNYSQTSLIEIRLTTDKEDYWEAKYMIDDIVDKNENNDFWQLTDEERALLSNINTDLQTDMYWARKFYNHHCFYQSLAFFTRIFNVIRTNWELNDNRKKSFYFDISYYIGFIYMELNRMDKAFYYLSIAMESGNISYLKEYINCLCNMKDPDTDKTILRYSSQVIDYMNQEENEEDSNMQDFYKFLNRRLAYVLIDKKQYDDAKNLLNHMLENDTDAEFAKRELNYLYMILKEKKNE